MAKLKRTQDGLWEIENDSKNTAQSNSSYREDLCRYLNCLDPIFLLAHERCKFDFLLSLFRVKGVSSDDYDPYTTTIGAVKAIIKAHDQIPDFISKRHLSLWLYAHIFEASEPYEILRNIIAVSQGKRYTAFEFLSSNGKKPLSPTTKINRLCKSASAAGFGDGLGQLFESWDRDLRNAIFHSDYTVSGGNVRVMRPAKTYSHEDILTHINRAIAYHEAITKLIKMHLTSYERPVRIAVPPSFSGDPGETAIVIVREGTGAIGLKDGWNAEELSQGHIPFRVGVFYAEEIRILDADPLLALLPARPDLDD